MKFTRRGFLKGITAAAAAVGFPVKAVAKAKETPASIANAARDRFDKLGIAAEEVTARMRELTRATKKASAAVSEIRDTWVSMGECIEFTDEYGGRWTSDDDGVTWTQFVDQPRRTYLPDRKRPGQYHVFEDGVLLDREG